MAGGLELLISILVPGHVVEPLQINFDDRTPVDEIYLKDNAPGL